MLPQLPPDVLELALNTELQAGLIGRVDLQNAHTFEVRIVTAAKRLLGTIYRPGFAYKKVGVLLLDLTSGRERQAMLFVEEEGGRRRKQLVQTMEEVAGHYGAAAAFLAAQGIRRGWRMRRNRRSPRYTTCWSDLLRVD